MRRPLSGLRRGLLLPSLWRRGCEGATADPDERTPRVCHCHLSSRYRNGRLWISTCPVHGYGVLTPVERSVLELRDRLPQEEWTEAEYFARQYLQHGPYWPQIQNTAQIKIGDLSA